MKHTFILSLSLVALSGGAGLGLSALHESTIPTEISVLSTPALETAVTGFIIPEFVPDVAPRRVAALEVFEDTVTDAVNDRTNDDTPLGDLTEDDVVSVPTEQPTQRETDAVVYEATEEPFEAQTASVNLPVRKSKVVARPILNVSQPEAPQRIEASAKTSLKYIVGVYR